MTEKDLLLKVFQLIWSKKMSDTVKPTQWLNTISYCHKRGLLYLAMQGEEVMAAGAIYRVPEWNEKFTEEIPEKDEGTIAYIPFFASKTEKRMTALRMIKNYLRSHPEVTTLKFYSHKSETDLRSYEVKREKEQSTVCS